MEDIILGYTLAKPVATQEECNAYTAMAQVVAAHNAACKVGDTLWQIEDKEDCYAVTDGGTVQEPKEPSDPEPTLKEQLAALQEDDKSLKEESEMLKQCLLEMSETVYA